MALETKCLTPDANFTTFISPRTIASTVNLPFDLNLDKEQAVMRAKEDGAISSFKTTHK